MLWDFIITSRCYLFLKLYFGGTGHREALERAPCCRVVMTYLPLMKVRIFSTGASERDRETLDNLRDSKLDNGEGRDEEGDRPLLEEAKATTVEAKVERKWWLLWRRPEQLRKVWLEPAGGCIV